MVEPAPAELEAVRYALGGFVIHSTWALPELYAATAEDGILGRIRVESGPMPDDIEGERLGPGVTVSPRQLLLDIDRVGRLWVTGGERIVAVPAPGVAAADLRPFILGSGIGAICHQRGLTALHGSAAIAGGRAAVFLGPQGAGKSTLLASLMREGLTPLSDDLTVVTIPEAGPAAIFPGVPRIKLWPDSAAALGVDAQELELSFQAKLQMPMLPPRQAATELGVIYLLEDGEGGNEPVRVERLTGDAAVSALVDQLYRPHWLPPGVPTFQRIVALKRLALTIPVFRLMRCKRMEHVSRVAGIVAAHATRHL